MAVEIPPREGQFLGIVQSFEKYWESPLRCTQQKNLSVINNGTTCDAAFRRNSLTTCCSIKYAKTKLTDLDFCLLTDSFALPPSTLRKFSEDNKVRCMEVSK